MDAIEIKDKLWTEIRQLVLDEGPAPESVDENMREHGIDTECREAIIAELIAFRCAEIERLSYGPMQGTPLPIIVGSWAGNMLDQDLRRLAEND